MEKRLKTNFIKFEIPHNSKPKLSLTDCKSILNKDGFFYTDEEIIGMRDWLYHMADIAMEDYI